MDEKTFMQSYEAFSDALFRHCYFRIYDRDKARDLVQETFCRAWDYAWRGHEIANLRAFLYRVATNLIIDESRKRRTVSLEDLKDKGFDPAGDAHEEILRKAEAGISGQKVLELLQELDPKYREVVVLRYVDGFSPKEISEILKESENVVSVRLHRAIKKLRQLI